MRKGILAVFLLGALVFVTGCGTKNTNANTSNEEEVKVGSTYVVDGQNEKVVGMGSQPFEYTATGESLTLMSVEQADYKAVLVPDAGAKVKVDPTKPSCMVNDTEKINDSWPKGDYLLLEYVPESN